MFVALEAAVDNFAAYARKMVGILMPKNAHILVGNCQLLLQASLVKSLLILSKKCPTGVAFLGR